MNRVLVLDANEQPLMPCHSARARQLLKSGRAAVYRRYPFTIIVKDRVGGDVQPTQIKIDPGSRTTGLVLVAEGLRGYRVIWAAELHHRGHLVHDKMVSRRQLRRTRRTRNLRYRPPRFDNRRRPDGWLPPSVRCRLENILTWIERLYRFAPLASISMELVKFDTQALENPEVNGVEYQQGTLFGYEVWEYLLEKWGRKCVYCGAENVPLEKEHIVPKSRGGSNRVSNLTVSCHPCNQEKGNQTATEYGFPHVQAQAKRPLRDAAAINASRRALWRIVSSNGLPVEVGSGGRTKYNRSHQNYPKAHWIDAACVGASGLHVFLDPTQVPLTIKAMGRGTRQMCQTDKYGFPIRYRTGQKRSYGFQTGDIVRAHIPHGKYAGVHEGRVTIRVKPSFTINGNVRTHAKYCVLLHRADGYNYSCGAPRTVEGL